MKTLAKPSDSRHLESPGTSTLGTKTVYLDQRAAPDSLVRGKIRRPKPKEGSVTVMDSCFRSFVITLLVFVEITTARAQAPQPQSSPENNAAYDQADLEKKAQNPIANLVTLPLQNNTGFDSGPYNRTQNVLNIQPVIPINLSKNWIIITRTIMPLVWEPSPNQNSGGEYGLGDMNPTFFLSPVKSKLTWGAGPALVIPTATNSTLGHGQFSLGPSVVVLKQPGPWTFANLVNNVWSVAGESGRASVNQMTDQYIVTRQIKKGWYVASSPIITADWRASKGDVWTIPFGGGVGRVTKLGQQPVNIHAQFFYNVAYPHGGSPWSMRLLIIFLYPKRCAECS